MPTTISGSFSRAFDDEDREYLATWANAPVPDVGGPVASLPISEDVSQSAGAVGIQVEDALVAEPSTAAPAETPDTSADSGGGDSGGGDSSGGDSGGGGDE